MAIKVKIYEFDKVDELKQYEELSKEKVKIEEEKAETKKPEHKKGFNKKFKAWTEKESKEFVEILKECKQQGLSSCKSLKVASEKLGRTYYALAFRRSKLGIAYNEWNPENTFFATSKRQNRKWSQKEDDYIISQVKPLCDAGNKISKKKYRKLEKALKRKAQSIKSRVYVLKHQGKLKKIVSDDRNKKKTENLLNARKYMMKSKAKIPEEKIYGKISEEKPLFSNLLNRSQEKALKDMVRNDLKTQGFSKIYREKISSIADLSVDEYLQLLQDMMANSHKFQKGLNATMKVKGIGQDKFIIFT